MPHGALKQILIAHLRTEAEASFPLLSGIAKTAAVQLIDYVGTLDAAGREELLAALAERAAATFVPDGAMLPRPPAFERYWTVTHSPGPLTGGVRYCDVRALSTVPTSPAFGGFERWAAAYTGLALEARPDLLPDRSCLVPARAPRLRALVDATLTRGGYTGGRHAGAMRYRSPDGAVVILDLGSRMGQLCYEVAPAGTPIDAPVVGLPRFSYEGSLWSLVGGWDYLTEENAARCVERLPGLIDATIRIADETAAFA